MGAQTVLESSLVTFKAFLMAIWEDEKCPILKLRLKDEIIIESPPFFVYEWIKTLTLCFDVYILGRFAWSTVKTVGRGAKNSIF